MIRVFLDIDDTIADFRFAYEQRFGKMKFTIQGNQTITQNVDSIHRDKKFWTSLNVIRRPNFKVSGYCTKRNCCKSYTKEWLTVNNFDDAPVYQVMGQYINKADYIKGRADVLIDDSIRNYEDCNKTGVKCILITTKENSKYNVRWRVDSLEYNEIERVYNEMMKADKIY